MGKVEVGRRNAELFECGIRNGECGNKENIGRRAWDIEHGAEGLSGWLVVSGVGGVD
jgi:hypothetical protein